MTRTTLLAVLAAFSFTGAGQATPLYGNSGFGPPVLTFPTTPALPPWTSVTSQFADRGVTFLGFFIDDKGFLVNFDEPGTPSDPASILFTSLVNRAAVGFQTQFFQWKFEALFKGQVIDDFPLPGQDLQQSSYYGFEKITFDQIRISPANSNGSPYFLVDSLLFSTSVPEPGTLALLGLGLTALFVAKRRSMLSAFVR